MFLNLQTFPHVYLLTFFPFFTAWLPWLPLSYHSLFLATYLFFDCDSFLRVYFEQNCSCCEGAGGLDRSRSLTPDLLRRESCESVPSHSTTDGRGGVGQKAQEKCAGVAKVSVVWLRSIHDATGTISMSQKSSWWRLRTASMTHACFANKAGVATSKVSCSSVEPFRP